MIIRLVTNTNRNDLVKKLDTQAGPSAWYLRKISELYQAFSLGAWKSNTVLCNNVVAATGTITLSAHVATDTVTVNGTVFTCVASGATGNQYNVGGSDTITATNLKTALNASVTTTVKGTMVATSSGAVVTITSAVPGNIGNAITLAISAHGSVSGARLTGGTEGNTSTFAHGL